MSDTPGLWDTHSHLDSREFAADLPAVLERAAAAGVEQHVTLGTDLASSQAAVNLAAAHPQILAAVGWHPNDVLHAPHDALSAIAKLCSNERVAAIGEIGLDYYRLPKSTNEQQASDNQRLIERQRAMFQQQLELAASAGLNVVIHQRDALADTLEVYRPFAGKTRAVFHCFAGDRFALRQILELDCLVSFTGILTYKNNDRLREALADCPSDRFMLETDCPYLAPLPHRGKRCEPSMVRLTAEAAAQLRHNSIGELTELTGATAQAFFQRRRG